MILSTLTEGLTERYGDEKAIKLIANAGFDAVDFSLFCLKEKDCPLNSADYKEYIRRIKATAQDNNVFFNQSHAPFPSYKFNNESYNDEIFNLIVKAIEIAGMLEVKNIVVHPVACPADVYQKKFNIDFYNKLLPYCKEYNVKIALENMFGRDNSRNIIPNVCSFGNQLADYYDALDREWFSVCLDVGHSGLVGENADAAIRAIGGRLKALHIHDNDLVEDLHTMPYLGKIDWDSVTKALADINYSGDFTFEAMNYYSKFDDGFVPQALAFLNQIGRHLIEKIENNK